MHHSIRRFLILGLLLWAGRAAAQELTILPVGDLSTSRFTHSTFSWQVDYRLLVTPNLALSEAYLNEGKITGHRRDGYATEGWFNLPMARRRIAFSAGAGIYSYFDTEGMSGDATQDVHGTAPIVSLSATVYLYRRLYARFLLNRIMPAHDIRVNTAVVGLGMWLGRGSRPEPLRLRDETATAPARNELTVYRGQSTVNTLRNEKAAAYSVELRRSLTKYLDASAAWINEGDPKVIRRNGIALEVAPTNSFTFANDTTVSIGMGLGAYVNIDHRNPRPGRFGGAAVSMLVSPTVAWEIGRYWDLRLVLHRVVTSYSRDADVFLLGVGYRWGE